MKPLQLLLALAVLLPLAACDSSEPDSPLPTAGTFRAAVEVDGDARALVGTAFVLDYGDGGGVLAGLQIDLREGNVGAFPSRQISFRFDPDVALEPGTYPFGEGEPVEALYSERGRSDGLGFYPAGDGTLTVEAVTDRAVRGQFDFTATAELYTRDGLVTSTVEAEGSFEALRYGVGR